MGCMLNWLNWLNWLRWLNWRPGPAGHYGDFRDVRGAYTVAVGDRCKTLDVPSEEPGEYLGLCLTQLRELRRDVRDGAVVLTQLVANGCDGYGSSVTITGQRIGKRGRSALCTGAGGCVDEGPVALLELGGAPTGKLVDRLRPGLVGEIAQRGDGQIVVRLGEPVAAGVGKPEHSSRSPASTPTVGPLLPCLHGAGRDEVVEVAANRGRCEPEPRCQRRCRRRAMFEDRRRHPLPGRGILRHCSCRHRKRRGWIVFHNTIVP